MTCIRDLDMQECAGRLMRMLCVLTGSQISDLNHNLQDHSIASARTFQTYQRSDALLEYSVMNLLYRFLALLPLLSLCLAASIQSTHDELIKLAAAGNGVIFLDERTYNLLTTPKRTWSATVQLTAMDKRRQCNPCK